MAVDVPGKSEEGDSSGDLELGGEERSRRDERKLEGEETGFCSLILTIYVALISVVISTF